MRKRYLIAVFLGTLLAPRAQAAITVSVEAPLARQLVEGYVFFRASIQSEFEVKTVVAKCRDRSMTLDPANSTYQGKVVLDSSWTGAITCNVAAEDVFGNAASKDVDVVVNRKPRLLIDYPAYGHAQSEGEDIRVKARCFDEDPCHIRIRRWGGETFNFGSEVDTAFSTAGIANSAIDPVSAINVVVEAIDEAGNTVSRITQVRMYQKGVFRVGRSLAGEILDLEGNRALLFDGYTRRVFIEDRVSGERDTLPYDFERAGDFRGRLSGSRTLLSFIEGSNPVMLEYAGGAMTKVVMQYWPYPAEIDYSYPGFASWQMVDTVYFRDFGADSFHVLGGVNYSGHALTEDGRLFYATPSSVTTRSRLYEWRNGDSKLVDTCGYPLSDGHRIVCTRQNISGGYSLVLREGDSARVVTSALSDPNPGRGYRMHKHWVGYTQVASPSQVQQVYLLDSLGVEHKATFFGQRTELRALCDSGKAMVATSQPYLISLGRTPLNLGDARLLPQVLCRDGDWRFLMGNSILALDTGSTSFARPRGTVEARGILLRGRRMELEAGLLPIQEASLYSLAGRREAHFPRLLPDRGRIFLDLSGLRGGMYFLSLRTAQGRRVARIVLD